MFIVKLGFQGPMGPSTLAPAGSLGLGEAHLWPVVLKPLFTSISFKGSKLFYFNYLGISM